MQFDKGSKNPPKNKSQIWTNHRGLYASYIKIYELASDYLFMFNDFMGFPGSSAGKKIHLQFRRPQFSPWVGKIPRRRDRLPTPAFMASLVAQTVKNSPAMQETWVQSLVGKIPWRRAWLPTPVFLPGESPWTESYGVAKSQTQLTKHSTRSL